MSDVFHTVSSTGRGQYTEQRSRFLSFAIHCAAQSDAKSIIDKYSREYHDARHVCWACRIGSGSDEYTASSDNGEPSGTAGRPILGQILSADLTDVVVIVVRYFGGIKLGTSGLIAAYREAASLAISGAGRIDGFRMRPLDIRFPYIAMNEVMKLVKATEGIDVLSQVFDNSCTMSLNIRANLFDNAKLRFEAIDGVTVGP